MMDKGLDFKHKEVVNITNGKRLGYVQDVCADFQTGRITSIIVPGGNNKFLSLFSNNNDISFYSSPDRTQNRSVPELLPYTFSLLFAFSRFCSATIALPIFFGVLA